MQRKFTKVAQFIKNEIVETEEDSDESSDADRENITEAAAVEDSDGNPIESRQST